MGSGIGNLDDIYNTAVSHEQGVSLYHRFCVPVANTFFRATVKYRRYLFLVFLSISPPVTCP
jgi:hypothetical protein